MSNVILIIGFGESGKWAYNLSVKNGYMPLLYDDKFMKVEDVLPKLEDVSFAVVSPGISLEHKLISVLNSAGIPVISEIEFAYYFKNIESKIIGVTGTNGKTTVVRQIANILKDDCILGGNIGVPYSKIVDSDKKYTILELSSFQLNNIINFKPDIAVITNLAPDHLDYHGNFDNYKNAKFNLIKNVDDGTRIIFCGEDELLCEKFSNKKNAYYFALNKREGCGIYIDGEWVKFEDNTKIQNLYPSKYILNLQRHNILNSLASSLVAHLLGKSTDRIITGLNSFIPSPYREQEVKNLLGLTIINDSKSTNLASTLTAIKNYKDKNICLIVGGKPKKEDYSKLFSQKAKIYKIIAYGEASGEFLDCAERCGYKKLVVAENLKESVELAFSTIQKGDCLLFSPACSSFDQFSSYEERGRAFDDLIRKYKKLI